MTLAGRTLLFTTIAASVTGAAALVDDRFPARGGSDVALFTISKSENKNVVQYVIRVDERCVPVPGAPIEAYWRMIERGPGQTEPLLPREQRAYGAARQSVSERTESGGKAVLVLAAVPSRPISIETFRGPNDACQALSNLAIGGEAAHLFDVYVSLKWPVGVSYILLRGWSNEGARVLTEKIEP